MTITEILNEGLKRRYALVLPAAELDARVDTKLAQAQPDITLRGFRKGKVPMGLLKKQFGTGLLQEATQEAIKEAIQKHFEDSGVRSTGQPQVEMTNAEGWKAGDDVQAAFSYEALPDIPAVNLKSIALEKLVVAVDEAAIGDALGTLAQTMKEFTPRARAAAAELGNQVVLDFTGTIEGAPFEGGTAEDFPLELGSNRFIPGFEDQLLGATAGETRAIPITFPAHYPTKHLAGKEAVFSCKIKEVKEAVVPPIDEALAKKAGRESLADLKALLRTRIGAEYAAAARSVMKRHLLDQLDSMARFDLPPSMVEAEAQRVAQDLWRDENPNAEAPSPDAIKPTAEHTALAERRVRLGLLLSHLGAQAKIEVSEAEMAQLLRREAQKYPGEERQFMEWAQKTPAIRDQLAAPVFEDKVVDYIFELAQLSDKTATKDELQRAIDTLDKD
ncbi:MAG: trigger factor [Rhodobacteraceae bacterium]|nr:trigger factor [Paracoccaceae bacterium]